MRLNLSHGSVEEHIDRLERVRSVAITVGKPVGVLADLPGPKVRAGEFPTPGVQLEAGSVIRFEIGDGPSDAELIRVDYPGLLDDLAVGDRVVIGDGAISRSGRTASSRRRRVAVVENGGRAQGCPGVHLPSERSGSRRRPRRIWCSPRRWRRPASSSSPCRSCAAPADMTAVREVVGDRAQLVAKIETSAALGNLAEIVAVSDAIMVARGDLGIDCPLEDVPHLQKSIVRQCVEFGVPVITATQMLESMITAPSPTRAEVSDVANAVFDGTDAVMLSAETAIGVDPAQVVATMGRIAERAEAEANYQQWSEWLGRLQRDHWYSPGDRITAALTHAASQAARDAGAAAILCCTRSGRTARAMARFRPKAQLIGLSPHASTVNRMTLSWGVDPIEVDTYTTTDEMVWFAVETAFDQGKIAAGDTVLVLAGAPDRQSTAAADVLRIVQVA